MSIHKQAIKAKLRFQSSKGPLTTEDLYDLPMESTTNRPGLKALAVALQGQIAATNTSALLQSILNSFKSPPALSTRRPFSPVGAGYYAMQPNESAALSTRRPFSPVGAGYYAMQPNESAAGVKYTTLVKADRSKPLQIKRIGKEKLQPSTGSRNDRLNRRRARSVKL